MKKKVVFLSYSDFWNSNSAASARVYNYASMLHGEDVEISYVPFTEKLNREDFTYSDEGFLIYKKYKSKKISSNLLCLINHFKFLVSLNKQFKDSFFYFYPTTNVTLNFFIVFYLILLKKRSVYYELSELREYASELSFCRRFFFSLKYKLERLTWRFYKGIVCISTKVEKIAKKYNKNTLIIPSLCTDKSFEYKNRTNKNEFDIVFTGSISFKKENLLPLLEAIIEFRKLEKCRLFLYGPISRKNNLLLKKFQKENDCFDFINYKGVISKTAVMDVLYEANLLVLPRRNNKQNYYGFSTKLAEYAMSGSPILLTKTGDISLYFKDNVNCYMVSGYEKKDFLNRMKEIIKVYSKTSNIISQNAYNTAMTFFSVCGNQKKFCSFLFKYD